MYKSHTSSIELESDFPSIRSSKCKWDIKKLFCILNCFKKYEKKNKKHFISEWRKYLTNESNNITSINDPFTILTNLWAHKKVIRDFENVRINPNLIKSNNNIFIRNDLEFYIPQLCSFILFGEFELVEESLSFLCKACYSSYFFAHRVVWFLKSMLTVNHNNVNFNNKIRNVLHIIQSIFKSDDDKKVLERYHIPGGEEYINFVNNNQNGNGGLDLNIFHKYGYCTNSEEDIIDSSINSIKQIDHEDINLSSFLSNINFYDHLCNICERIKYLPNDETRQEELIKELNKLNNNMPYNIYIPFSTSDIRNYIIGKISIKDSKVFKTKERAPILITAECFRLEEWCYDKKLNSNLNENDESNMLETERINLNGNLLGKRKTYNNKTGISDSSLHKQLDKISYMMSVDIELNKPIFVKKHDEEEEEEINDIKYKYENGAKNEINTSIKKKRRHSENDYKKIELVLQESKNELKNENSITKKLASSLKLTPIQIPNNKDFNNKISPSIISKNSPSSDSPSSESSNPNSPNNIQETNKNIFFNSFSFNSIFGESISLQESHLKSQSQYGYLNSYKIFKFLVKSGEDLRQEQFASQLINEFAQIFKIEKVKCYLYPYEIIATGNNAGIIEIIPNAISLDQLKQKISSQNYSLKQFYEHYFGLNTNKYKKAIKNLIRSLAGYSLVCYFLQLKDRHNGNIMIDNEGHLIHIDFGFIFSHAPGGEFEKAPFKLTDEIMEVLGGIESKNFQIFRKLMWDGMIAISKHYKKIMILTEMMFCGYGTDLLCFERGQDTLQKLKERFCPKEKMKNRDYLELVDNLIENSLGNWRTKWYDKYQYYFQGIFY